MPTALLADDEPMLLDVLRDQLGQVWPGLDVVAVAADGNRALSLLRELRPDVAFLDVQMPGLTGLEVVQALGRCDERGRRMHTVFITAHDDRAAQAFEAEAADFIVKPLEPRRLAQVVARLQKELARDALPSLDQVTRLLAHLGAPAAPAASLPSEPRLRWLKVAVGNSVRMVDVADVRHFESDTKYTRVVMSDGHGLIRTSIRELMQKLGEEFVLAHRGVLVNRRYIRAMVRRGDQMELEMADGKTRLKVSQVNQHLFRSM